jgi:nucleotide-binding universal stress UspA family protein
MIARHAANRTSISPWSQDVNRLSRILVAVDFSAAARAAFDQALALSRAHGADLTVVHAVPANRPFGWRARERIALIARLRDAAESFGVRFSVGVQHGDPAGVILLHARSRRSDLIVLGTHQRTGLDRLRAGSVAERVALRAEQPVLVVPSRRGIEAARRFDNIVVAVDFSDASNRAVEQALAFARRTNGRLTLVHVVPGSSTGVPRHLYRYGLVEYQNRMTHDGWRRLQDVVPRDTMTAAQVHARVVTGDPVTEIARIAAEIDADLVVVGVSRRRAILRRLFGGTSARVMRVAEQPVIAVPEIVPPEPAAEDARTLPTAA